jgi:hypothetical protein
MHLESLQSWLYDWQDVSANSIIYNLAHEGQKYRAAGDSTASVHTLPREDAALLFKVSLIGEVSELAPQFARNANALERLQLANKDFFVRREITVQEIQVKIEKCF